MKNSIAVFIALTALFTAIFAFVKWDQTKKNNALLEERLAKLESNQTPKEEHVELAVSMQRFQWYANKLYFAGQANNPELTEFYLHELEEAMEELIKGNPMEDDKPISNQLRTYGKEQTELFYDHIVNHGLGEFNDRYTSLINSCNSCHVLLDHAFIKIEAPLTPIADNQSYLP